MQVFYFPKQVRFPPGVLPQLDRRQNSNMYDENRMRKILMYGIYDTDAQKSRCTTIDGYSMRRAFTRVDNDLEKNAPDDE